MKDISNEQGQEQGAEVKAQENKVEAKGVNFSLEELTIDGKIHQWVDGTHRKRKVKFKSFKPSPEGLAALVAEVGAEMVVDRFMSFYVARNGLLAQMDREDDPKFEGTVRLPGKDSEETIYFDLTKNLPKPGERRTKWGSLKPFIEQTLALLAKNGEKDPSDERVRTVAERLKAQYDKMQDALLSGSADEEE